MGWARLLAQIRHETGSYLFNPNYDQALGKSPVILAEVLSTLRRRIPEELGRWIRGADAARAILGKYPLPNVDRWGNPIVAAPREEEGRPDQNVFMVAPPTHPLEKGLDFGGAGASCGTKSIPPPPAKAPGGKGSAPGPVHSRGRS